MFRALLHGFRRPPPPRTYSNLRAVHYGDKYEYYTRDEIIARDGRRCYICGRRNLKPWEIELDHVIPLSHGGPDTKANVRVACRACNRRKGAQHYVHHWFYRSFRPY